MAIQDSDLFLIDDAGVSKKIRADKLKGGLDSTYANMKLLVNKPDYSSRYVRCRDLQSNLPDDHWLMVERSSVSYKVNGADVHDYFPSGPAGATGVITDSHSPGTPTATCETELISNVKDTTATTYEMGYVPKTGSTTPNWSEAENVYTISIGDTYPITISDQPVILIKSAAGAIFGQSVSKDTNPGGNLISVSDDGENWEEIGNFSHQQLYIPDGGGFVMPKQYMRTHDDRGYNNQWSVSEAKTLYTLTFPSDQGFDCFLPGDVVQGGDIHIIAIDKDNNEIVVNGGNWTGTDGSGIPWYESEVWSTGVSLINGSYITPVKNGFNGVLTDWCNSSTGSTITINLSGYGLSGPLKVYSTSGTSTGSVILSAAGGLQDQTAPTGYYDWVELGNISTITTITIHGNGVGGPNFAAVEINGQILVDATEGVSDKLVSTVPRLTVASLANPNFADNEAIRMVNVDGDTASYVPVTNTITNVENLDITPIAPITETPDYVNVTDIYGVETVNAPYHPSYINYMFDGNEVSCFWKQWRRRFAKQSLQIYDSRWLRNFDQRIA